MPRLSGDGSRLELGEHPHFEQHWRWIQLAVFTILGLLLVAGLLGVFGSGPLATQKTAYAGGQFTLTYPRFARSQAPADIVIEPRAAPGGQLAVHLDQVLAEGLRVKAITPKPFASGPDPAGVFYLFSLAPGANGKIDFALQPGAPGVLHGNIGINGVDRPITQVIWP